ATLVAGRWSITTRCTSSCNVPLLTARPPTWTPHRCSVGDDLTCTTCGNHNPEGNRYCGMCGSPLARQLTGRERRRVSVVFVDLVAFSSMTRGLDPEEVRDLADRVLTAVAGVIEDFDGYVDSFKGDGLIALFGAPHSHPDDPQRAVLAAAKALET